MILENIRELCAKKGVSIADIEANTVVGKNVIYRWDKSEPSVTNLKAVADYFGVTVDELIKGRSKQ